MLHFFRGRSPNKMLNTLAIGRLPRVLPGAESPANLLIANDLVRGLAPGKCAPSKGPGSTPEDNGDDSDDSSKEHYPPFIMPKKMTNFKWLLGARFGTKDEFKEAITNYAIYDMTCLKRFKN
ncbi:hypothetical protein MTR_5g056120 [Medicago truncatula]|uniref:Uncharacterized protein n=1 Tax=Medicago truncatula TaxID=3880 RepID=G7K0J6_MEDTR|nr:hypothetical protein MTR_5g056120 [Medicago truncatula]